MASLFLKLILPVADRSYATCDDARKTGKSPRGLGRATTLGSITGEYVTPLFCARQHFIASGRIGGRSAIHRVLPQEMGWRHHALAAGDALRVPNHAFGARRPQRWKV